MLTSIGPADRIIAALVGLYFCYRILSALNTGIYDGDGDRDVHAEEHPTAFGLTILSSMFVIAVCGYFALMPGKYDLADAISWFRKTFL